jgi:hypothetical protein
MADVFLDRDEVHVVLGPLERLGALHGDLVLPIDRVREASIAANPFTALRGMRSPGTGWPGVIALGTWRSRTHGRSFVAAYRNRPALVLDVDDEHLARIVVSTPDAERLAASLAR